MRLIFDSHLDLAWSAVSFDRDLTRPLEEVRGAEGHMTDEPSRGRNVLTLPELRRAGVGVCVGTLLARGGPEWRRPAEGSKRTGLDHADPSLAFAQAHAQLAWYRLMESRGLIRMIRTRGELSAHWAAYQGDPERTPLGVILSMEGADPVMEPEQLGYWWDQGLRAIGPAHYGRGQYAYGTGVDGPIGARGGALLREMNRFGVLLDVTHLSDTSFWEAMTIYEGPVLASHHNCRTLVPGDRQLSDEQIREVVKRGGVIGTALDAWMLYPNWVRRVTSFDVVGLSAVVDHMDHVCQIAGNSRHAALGTDLDGGFGNEQTPRELRRYSDLQQLGDLLLQRGYGEGDVDGIFHGNWLRVFGQALPV